MSTSSVRTRFAPSPTGVLHIGGVRTALFCWLYARHHGGQFVLRIEDTDRARSTEESVNIILEGLQWLELGPDEGPFFQSQRIDRYQAVAERMLDDNLAYRCYCSPGELEEMRAAQIAAGKKPRYDGRCRERTAPPAGVEPVIRFRNPASGQVVIDDRVHGAVVFDNSELDDLVIVRSDGTPTYHFSVVVDDADMQITHVIRGDDHLNNTPRQVNMLRALGIEPPAYAHLPMIVGADGAKLSKRHGSVNVLAYRDQGYLPDAVLNYLVRLGWAHGDKELFDREEMIALFDLSGVQRSPARFDAEKLDWLNQQYIMNAPVETLAKGLAEQFARIELDASRGPSLETIVAAFRSRAKTLGEMAEKARVYCEERVEYEPKAAKKFLQGSAADRLKAVRERLHALGQWTEEATQAAVESVASSAGVGLGKVAQPVRVAVTGGTASPGIGTTLVLLGREKTLERLDRAIDYALTERSGS